MPMAAPLDHFRSEGDDLHELALAKLAGHGSEDAGSLGLLLVVDQDGRVLVEADVRTVLTANFLARAHEHGLVDFALLRLRTGDGVLDGDDDDVAEHPVPLPRASQDLHDARDARARIVRDDDDAAWLNHGFLLPLLLSARRA